MALEQRKRNPKLPQPSSSPLPTTLSNALENRNRTAKSRAIIPLRHDADAIDRNHVFGRLGAQAPDVDVGRAVDGQHVLLAGLGREAGLGVVVEQGVESIGGGEVSGGGGGRGRGLEERVGEGKWGKEGGGKGKEGLPGAVD